MRITGWYIRLERHDARANRHRHYSLYFGLTLWHPRGTLVPRWGRVPGFGSHTGYTRTGAPQGRHPAPEKGFQTRKYMAFKRRQQLGRFGLVSPWRDCVISR